MTDPSNRPDRRGRAERLLPRRRAGASPAATGSAPSSPRPLAAPARSSPRATCTRRPHLVRRAGRAVAAALRRRHARRRAAPVGGRHAVRPRPGQDGDPARRRGYSGFDGTDLADCLRGRGVKRVLVAGIATDYCVRATALDAIRGGIRDHRADRRDRRSRRRAWRRPSGRSRGARRRRHARPGARCCAAGERWRRSWRPRAARCARWSRRPGAAVQHRPLRWHRLGGGAGDRRPGARARERVRRRAARPGTPSRCTSTTPRRRAAAAGLPDDNFLTVSIEPILAGIAAARPDVARRADIRFGNASARARMIVIYDLAQELDALVLGTENRSEYYLGYFTRFGDAASDIEPISDLYKTEVRRRPRARPARGGASQAPDGRALGRPDRRGRARLHLPRCRPRAGGELDLGMSPAEAAERAGVAPDVVDRVLARAAGVAWKHDVPHTLVEPFGSRPRAAAACRPTPRARAAPRPRAGGRARG